MQAEELSIEIPGVRLAAKAFGPPRGQPVLALHGWQDNAGSFDRLAPLLTDARVIALDLAGHGRSGWRPNGAAYVFVDWVVDIHAVLDALGWERCSLLGHSLGGAIANCVAGTWPQRVDRVALIDGFAPRTQEPGEGPDRVAEFVRRRALRIEPRVYADRSAAAQRLTEAIGGLSETAARVLVERGTRDLSAGGVTWARDPRLVVGPPLRLGEAQILAFLARVLCPVLWVEPQEGWAKAGHRVDAARRALARLEIASVAGGHHAHLDHPREVADQVAPFLAANRR